MSGRGLDLLRVSRADGTVLGRDGDRRGRHRRQLGRVRISGSFRAEAAADLRGEPIAEAVLRVDATGAITKRVVPTRQMYVNGVAAADGQVWLFDAVAGLLVRLPA